MIIIKTKEIPEINKKVYYKKIECICDNCSEEIREAEEYLAANYSEGEYYDTTYYKEFCKKCMKESIYDIVMHYAEASFYKCRFYKSTEWEDYYATDAFRYGYIEESEWENIKESEEKI